MYLFSAPLNFKEKIFWILDLLIFFTTVGTLFFIPFFALYFSKPLLFLVLIYPAIAFSIRILLNVIARLNVGKKIKFLWITITCKKFSKEEAYYFERELGEVMFML